MTPLGMVAASLHRTSRSLRSMSSGITVRQTNTALSDKSYAVNLVLERHALMHDVFRHDDISPVGLWMEIFYRRPHIEFFSAALLECIRTPGLMTGPQSLSGAVFLAEIFKRACPTTTAVLPVMQSFMTALEADGLTGDAGAAADPGKKAHAAEVLDTILRGLWMANRPHLDLYLHGTGAEWSRVLGQVEQGEAEEGEGGWTAGDDKALLESLFPPEGERNRTHIVRWPIPPMALTSFEQHIRAHPFPLYGATRYWFMHTHALRKVALDKDPVKSSRLQLLSPPLATGLSHAMTDALWAYFYATGDGQGTVARVMDIATGYGEFLEEFGDTWVTQYSSTSDSPPEALLDSPVALMNFQSSRYALWSLLTHARRHTRVGEAWLDHMGKINDEGLSRDPLGTEGLLTAFGRQRFQLMQLLLPSVTQLTRQAQVDGIGSGNYPASYAKLLETNAGDASSPLKLPLLPSSIGDSAHHSAVAVDSRPVREQMLASDGAESRTTVQDLGARDRRKIGLALRSSKMRG